ncbi:MAG: hypothetical protein M1838_001923 [Thelocarpon superellum]|nr:MAG: hypothetical protein M1838_001923 [Thelocarpon superellum]
MFASLKRRAADDEGEGGFGELSFESKKRRVLPIRPSPISTSHFAFQNFSFVTSHTATTGTGLNSSTSTSTSTSMSTSTMTPVDLAVEESMAYRSVFSSSPTPGPGPGRLSAVSGISTPGLSHGDEHDLDMSDCSPLYAPPSFILSPPSTQTRLPTPIFGSFFLHPPSARRNRDSNLIAEDPNDPMSKYRNLERRGLPSPISEGDDGLLSPLSGAGTMMGRLGVGTSEALVEEEDGVERMEVVPDTPTTPTEFPRRGRSRSRRADGKDCAEGPGEGKPVLSMGYRADCEKCIAKVPGHYSHVIRA